MSTQPNDGGPAFPATVQDDRDCAPRYVGGYGGMSLRDWFASNEKLTDWDNPEISISKDSAEALAGEPRPEKDIIAMFKWEAKWRAALKYIRADAMLAARERKEDAT